jgi:hypothetical protein
MNAEQGELFGLILPFRPSFRLRANDVFRFNGELCRVIRVNECAAVVVMNRRTRTFVTRFDKHVRLKPSPVIFRIGANSEVEVLNPKPKKRKRKEKV